MAGLSIAIGAFGSHALKEFLEANHRVDTFETAARYQMYGALSLILTGIIMANFPDKLLRWAGNTPSTRPDRADAGAANQRAT